MSDPQWPAQPEPRPAGIYTQPPVMSGPPQPAHRRGPSLLAVVVVATITALIVGSVAGLAGYLVGKSVDGVQEATIAAPVLTEDTAIDLPVGADVAAGIGAIAQQVLPSVVSIEIEAGADSGSGSGFVVSEDGYILTNNHVAAPASNGGSLTVYLEDGRSAKAKIIGRNSSYDLAVLKVDLDSLQPIALGDSEKVNVGDMAIAIGAPLGLSGTVTAGIISSLDRPVTAGGSGEMAYINAIQTDAAINPGNSGGPLINAAGQVIGVNSAIASLAPSFSGEAGSIGLGFAIPINSAKRIAEEIIQTGSAKTPIIGVTLDTRYTGEGAKVSEVTADGPADAAGIRPGDIITGINGRTTLDATELVVAVRSYAPGDVVEVAYDRNGREASASVTLGASENVD
jgi:putative serine protease PepD